MSDPELAAIRAARMNQLQQQGGAGGGAQAEEDGGKQAAEEQMRRDLLATILDSAARERRTSCNVSCASIFGVDLFATVQSHALHS